MTRFGVTVVASILVTTLAAPANATLNACAAAKKMCVAKKTAALLKCHIKNEKPPNGFDPAKFAECIQKAKDKFDGGPNPSKGCFAKVEAKFGANCLTSGDTNTLENEADTYVGKVVCLLDPAGGVCATPVPTPTSTPSCVAINGSCSSNAQCCSLSCSGGQCVPSCSNGIQDGTESDVDCGGGRCPACGTSDSCFSTLDCVPNAVCEFGSNQCACAPNRADCNFSNADGCEIDLSNDTANCGHCNTECSFPNATAQCASSQCGIAYCDSGRADCDSVTETGCEVDLNSNNNNCGSCGNVCTFPMMCAFGSCQGLPGPP